MGGPQEAPITLALVVPDGTPTKAVENALRNGGLEDSTTIIPLSPEDLTPRARALVVNGLNNGGGIGRILDRIATDETNRYHPLVRALKTHQGTVTLRTLIEESGLPGEKIEDLVTTVFSGHIAFEDGQGSDGPRLNCPHFIPKEVNRPKPVEIFSSV